MPQPAPENLTADHLVYVMLPSADEEERLDRRQHYDRLVARLDGQLQIAELWKDRFVLLPPPRRQQSLQELVQAARRRLREERLRDDTAELKARKWIVERVIEKFAP